VEETAQGRIKGSRNPKKMREDYKAEKSIKTNKEKKGISEEIYPFNSSTTCAS
jgi:hypothetical protein